MTRPFQVESALKVSEIRRRLDREWAKYVVDGIEPEAVRPLILESWRRCSDAYEVDPAMGRSPLTIDESELRTRCELSEIRRLGEPFLRELTASLAESGHVLTLFDADGWMLTSEGDPHVRESLSAINFFPGANWREDVVGTNGPGTALAERKPVQVFASEHFVEAWHPWVCSGAPLTDPFTGELLGVLDATGYREQVHPHTLLAVTATARLIEREIERSQAIHDWQIVNDYSHLAAGRLTDGLVALDHRGRVLRLNPAALRILALDGPLSRLPQCPALHDVLLPFLKRRSPSLEPYELEVHWARTDRTLSFMILPVSSSQRVEGMILLISERARKARLEPASAPAPRTLAAAASARYTFEDILGSSPGIEQARRLARCATGNDLPVLIAGESGTGKELFAQAIHNAGTRARMPFVTVSCGSIPHELTEAELYGYEAGAFTGAKRGGRVGKLEAADGGTVFLDEIGELSPTSQVALLRALQEKEIVRVGNSFPRRIDVRVISATNRALEAQVEAGRFRRDLYYRLNVLPIELPPLRFRANDIRLLAETFLQAAAQQLGRAELTFSPEALEALEAYDWPGNIRELKNLVQRVVALTPGGIVGWKDLPAELRAGRQGLLLDPSPAGREQRLLVAVLRQCRGNVAEASRRLGVSRMTVYRRMRKLSIPRALVESPPDSAPPS